MRTNVIINTIFSAIHRWEGCPFAEVSYLRNPHRHVFHVTIKIPVTHTDRDIEFIMKKEEINKYLKELEGTDIGNMSCEDIAVNLLERFGACYVCVMEDGENGGEVYED